MSWYIDSVMVYPEKEFREYVDGRVVATVTIDTAGVIADTRIIRSAGQTFDAEALRIIRSLPRFGWAYSGLKKTTKYAISVPFSPERYEKAQRKKAKIIKRRANMLRREADRRGR